MVHDALAEAARGRPAGDGLDAPELIDDVVLLASELCENAVLHAGTAFELAVVADDDEVTVAVTDRGPGSLELHLAEPRQRYGRAATHGRGLSLVARLATTWGTRHEADGRHTVWFAFARGPSAAEQAAATPAPEHTRDWSAAEEARWLLHVPASLAGRLHPVELVRELATRLCDLVDAEAVVVEVDPGDGSGRRELARAGAALPEGTVASGSALEIRCRPRPASRAASGSSCRRPATPARARQLTELIAWRIAITAESQWLRDVDQRRRAWMTYQAEVTELLGQSLDVDLTAALVPQLVVPRLGAWCAVLLPGPSRRLHLAAIAHADEDRLTELRAVVDPDARPPGPPPQLRARLAAVHRGAGPPGSPTRPRASRSRCGPAGPAPGCCWWGARRTARTPRGPPADRRHRPARRPGAAQRRDRQ